MSSTSRREQGARLGAAPDEAGDAGRVAHDVPGVVVEVHAHEQVAREDLLLRDDLLAALELDDVFHRDDDLEDPLLDTHRAHAAGEVLLHLVLVARVRVHDVPVAGPVERTGLGRLLVFVLDVLELGVGGEVDLGRRFVDRGLLDRAVDRVVVCGRVLRHRVDGGLALRGSVGIAGRGRGRGWRGTILGIEFVSHGGGHPKRKSTNFAAL